MMSSLLSGLPMATSAVACSLILVAQVIIIYASSIFMLLPLPNQSAFGTVPGPNEQIAFYSERDGNQEIYVMNAADGSNQSRLTFSTGNDSNPSWSPDGTKIAFDSNRNSTEQEKYENHEIYVMNAADGSNQTSLTF